MSRHRRVKRHWWHGVRIVLLVLIAGILVTGAVVVNLGHLEIKPVLSGSMRPGIQPGDLAIVRPIQVNRLRVGEVIAYLPPNQTVPVMHRIVSISSAGIVTKGDANRVTDPWGRVKPQSKTVEHLVAVVPKVGWLIDIRRQLLTVVGGVVLLAVAVALWPSGRKKPDERRADTKEASGNMQPAEKQLLVTQGRGMK